MEKYNESYATEMGDYKGSTQATAVDIKDDRMLEASEIYGNLETAEKYGYVTRGYVQTMS